MPDITMCANKYCPLRDHCYRAQAKPCDYWQSWVEYQFERFDDGRVKCPGYQPHGEPELGG